MSTYNHLTLNERIKIMTMTPKKSAAAIAAELGRSKSTILRELRRYEDGYDAIRAQADYEQKRKACRRKCKLDDPELYALVKEKFLEQQWSPEQIQCRLRHENSQHSISSATIYR
uniref:helix-turn-helix domain-containing protein n=1 Tax=Cardiobacterium hominis TaxID=2718 RepID=UPI0028E95C86